MCCCGNGDQCADITSRQSREHFPVPNSLFPFSITFASSLRLFYFFLCTIAEAAKAAWVLGHLDTEFLKIPLLCIYTAKQQHQCLAEIPHQRSAAIHCFGMRVGINFHLIPAIHLFGAPASYIGLKSSISISCWVNP